MASDNKRGRCPEKGRDRKNLPPTGLLHRSGPLDQVRALDRGLDPDIEKGELRQHVELSLERRAIGQVALVVEVECQRHDRRLPVVAQMRMAQLEGLDQRLDLVAPEAV